MSWVKVNFWIANLVSDLPQTTTHSKIVHSMIAWNSILTYWDNTFRFLCSFSGVMVSILSLILSSLMSVIRLPCPSMVTSYNLRVCPLIRKTCLYLSSVSWLDANAWLFKILKLTSQLHYLLIYLCICQIPSPIHSIFPDITITNILKSPQ